MPFLRKHSLIVIVCLIIQCCNPGSREDTTATSDNPQQTRDVWTKEEANEWYAAQEWLVGANFNPSTAINQLEVWQKETFDTATINRELGWAADLGMNTMRVYLHDFPHRDDREGFLERMDTFLAIADRHNISITFVLFDSVWDPFPKPGKQREPAPHVHNSGWVQNPGIDVLQDTTQYPRLERYVKDVIGRFSNDERVLAWDLWNEPENPNKSSYGHVELENKADYVLPLLKKTYVWARSVNPSQPLTSGVWKNRWDTHEGLTPIEKVQIEESDVISFHNYSTPEDFTQRVEWLQRYGRPLLCTEYMARPSGSTFQNILPLGKQYNIAMYNWGFVDGKTNTKYPWDSWVKKYTAEPDVWFHEVLRNDGTPYDEEETTLIRELTGALVAP